MTKSVVVREGEVIPFNGRIVAGCAIVDESACCGVSKPVCLDSAAGQLEVYKDALIVTGWLEVQMSESDAVEQPERQCGQDPLHPSESNCDVAAQDATHKAKRAGPVLVVLSSLFAAALCAELTYFLTHHQLAPTVAMAVLGFLGMLHEMRR